jgi:hypothetical protein
MFGKDVQLNFNDDDVYRTSCGGLFTGLFVGVLLVFFAG